LAVDEPGRVRDQEGSGPHRPPAWRAGSRGVIEVFT
jgi:hypothetical protein